MKLVNAGIFFVVMALGCRSAWAEPDEALGAAYYLKGLVAYQRGNYATALQWYRKAVEQGDADAQYELGIMYANGQGVLQDYTEAVRWYRKAVEQGNARGQNGLGVLYSFGWGVRQDYAEAVKWYRKAAEQGNDSGQFNLSTMYENGYGVLQDYLKAHMWANLAGSNGNMEAIKSRDRIAGSMIPTQITEAQRRARICLESNYQNCD